MKVALFIDSLGSGGAQRQIVNLACILKKREIDCCIIYFHNKNHYKKILDEYGIKTKLIKKYLKYDISLIFRLAAHIRKEKYTILTAYLFTPIFYALMTKIILLCRIKLLISERSSR